MNVVRQLRLLVLGETWTLPLGVAAVLLAGAVLHHLPRAPGVMSAASSCWPG